MLVKILQPAYKMRREAEVNEMERMERFAGEQMTQIICGIEDAVKIGKKMICMSNLFEVNVNTLKEKGYVVTYDNVGDRYTISWAVAEMEAASDDDEWDNGEGTL